MTLLTLELRRRLEQFQLLAARRAALSPSAQRMNMNSRGCQPTEPRRKTNTTLKGSNHEMSSHARRTSLRRHHIIRPLKSRGYLCMHSVGLTHGYSRCSPSVNRTSAARRREHHHSMLEVECWKLNISPAQRVSFVTTSALTPALSPGRGRIVRRLLSHRTSFSVRSFYPANNQPAAAAIAPSESFKRIHSSFPLPGGEGQGEGERQTNFKPDQTTNTQHPTSNIQWTPATTRWALDVRCWLLDVPHS
jgi:hypothetical protein